MFGRWRGRNVVFLTIVGLMVVPLQVAILPVVEGFDDLGKYTGWNPYGTIEGVVIFHVAFGLAVRHLLDAQLLPRDTRRT